MLKYEAPVLKDACGIFVAYTNACHRYIYSILVDESLRIIIRQFYKSNNGELNIDAKSFIISLDPNWTSEKHAVLACRYIDFEYIDTYDITFKEFINIFTMNEYMENCVARFPKIDIDYFISSGLRELRKNYYQYKVAIYKEARLDEIFAVERQQQILNDLCNLQRITGSTIDIPENYLINRKKG